MILVVTTKGPNLMKLSRDANAACYCDLNDAVFGTMTIVTTFGTRMNGLVAVGLNEEGEQELRIDAVDDDANPYCWSKVRPVGMLSDLAPWASSMLFDTMFAADLLRIGLTLRV
jgi:hypothetical protein